MLARSQEQRDLSFQPVDKTGLRTLRAEQVDRFNECGYYHPLTLFSGREVDATRGYMEHLFDLLREQGVEDNYALLGYHTRCPGLYDLAMSDRILDVVEDIIGPDIICWTSHVFCKTAYDPKSVPFHQDASYWPLTPSRTVTAWLAIDDSDAENSCLQVIPGTHKIGHLQFTNVKGEVLDQKIDNLESYGQPARIELRAGQFSIHADLIAHGSDPNASSRRRCGFAIRYCPPTVKPLKASWARNAILCRGKDTTGYWTYNERPQQDDVSSWQSYWLQKIKEGSLKATNTREDFEGGNIGA